MSNLEDRVSASLKRRADQVTMPPDAWAENQRRLAQPRSHTGWVVAAVAAAAVVAVAVVTAFLVVGGGKAPAPAAGTPPVPAAAAGREFGDPTLSECVRQMRAGNGDIAEVAGGDPTGTPVAFRLTDDGLCMLNSVGGEILTRDRGLSDEVPFFAFIGGDSWVSAVGAVTPDVDRITFTPAGAVLPTITSTPTTSLGPLHAYAVLLPGAGTIRFLDGTTVVGESEGAPLPFSPATPDTGGVGTSAPAGGAAAPGSTMLVPAADRLPVGLLSGADVATGTPRSLSDGLGRPMVVQVWGSWCGPCRTRQPEMNTAAAALSGSDVQFLGLDVNDDPAYARDFQTLQDVPYPSIVTTPDAAAAALPGLPAATVPVVALVDRQGRVAQVFDQPTGNQITASAVALAAE